jgi:pre-rRNA-processing protein TSR1
VKITLWKCVVNEMSGIVHRSTLKQTNRPFKGKSNSKRAEKDKNHGFEVVQLADVLGRVERAAKPAGTAAEKQSRVDRLNQAKQRRDAKWTAAMKRLRGTADHDVPPRVTVKTAQPLMTLQGHSRPLQYHRCSLRSVCHHVQVPPRVSSFHPQRPKPCGVRDPIAPSPPPPPHSVGIEKQRLTLIAPSRDVDVVMRALQLADVILLVNDAASELDAFGALALSLASATGLPSVVAALKVPAPPPSHNSFSKGLHSFTEKKRGEYKKAFLAAIGRHVPALERAHSLDDDAVRSEAREGGC